MLEKIEKLKESTKAELIIPIHDFYPICPNYTLLNHKDDYCNIPDFQECKECLKSDFDGKLFLDSDIDISMWRDGWEELLELSDKILCFSNSSKDILTKAYNDIDISKIEVIPHKAQQILEPISIEKRENKSITIGVLGAISRAKGANIIKELVDRIDRDNLDIKVVLIGEISTPIDSPSFTITGRYQRDRLPKLIEKHKVDIFLIPSIWAETFSYTTQEIMMMDMPLMVFNLGAPAERVKNYSKGVILEKDYIDSIIEHIL